jgi:hypothetical protein
VPPLPPPPSVEVVVVGGGAVVVLDVLVVDVDVDVVVVEVVVLPVFSPLVDVPWAPLAPVGVVFRGMLVSVELLPHPATSPPRPIASAATATPSRIGRRAGALRVLPGSRPFKTIRRGPAGAGRSTGSR